MTTVQDYHTAQTAKRSSETKLVKQALIKAGYENVHVGHGSGTASGWLHLRADAKPGQSWGDKYNDLCAIAQRVTGRTGDYGGRINAS